MMCHNVDDETLYVFLQMQLDDLENIKQSRKGKGRQDELSDADFAVDVYTSELQSCILLALDKQMCKSIARANQLDRQLVSSLETEEKQAAEDRKIAIRLSYKSQVNDDPSADFNEAKPTADVDDKLLSKLKFLYISTDGDDEDVLAQPELSAWAASRGQTNRTIKVVRRQKRQYNSCLSSYTFTDVACCPYSHKYY